MLVLGSIYNIVSIRSLNESLSIAFCLSSSRSSFVRRHCAQPFYNHITFVKPSLLTGFPMWLQVLTESPWFTPVRCIYNIQSGGVQAYQR